MSLKEIREKRNEIIQIADRYGAHNLRIFGSQARGTEREDSDIDILVDFKEHNLLEQIGLIQELEDFLGKKIHLATEQTLHPDIREQVLKEAIQL
ncbi:MAG: nucleotidyltransferase family protein [Brevibacillus sp.]|nr:nucleotidyltransferase family protein [Brevibacillus sp.]